MNMPPHVGRMPLNMPMGMPPNQMMQYPPGVIPAPGGGGPGQMFQDRPPHFGSGGNNFHQQNQFGRGGSGGPPQTPLSLPHAPMQQQQQVPPPGMSVPPPATASQWEKPS
jgi:hypothetical protein